MSSAMVAVPTDIAVGSIGSTDLRSTIGYRRRSGAARARQREGESLPHFASAPLVGIMNRDWTGADLLTRRADDPDCEQVAWTGRPSKVGKQLAERGLIAEEGVAGSKPVFRSVCAPAG